MVKKNQYLELNKALQDKVKKELLDVEKGSSNKNIVQLKLILEELQLSEKKIGLTLKYPRIIIDSWGFDDELGIELLKASELYAKL